MRSGRCRVGGEILVVDNHGDFRCPKRFFVVILAQTHANIVLVVSSPRRLDVRGFSSCSLIGGVAFCFSMLPPLTVDVSSFFYPCRFSCFSSVVPSYVLLPYLNLLRRSLNCFSIGAKYTQSGCARSAALERTRRQCSGSLSRGSASPCMPHSPGSKRVRP